MRRQLSPFGECRRQSTACAFPQYRTTASPIEWASASPATVQFDTSIAVVADDAPVLMLEFPGAIKKSATYSGPGTGSFAALKLDFEYEVEVGERHSGVGIAANALNTNPC